MRVRNIPGVDDLLRRNNFFIDIPQGQNVNWRDKFNNDYPIHLEIGMGKGQFLMALAKKNPQVNYIGMEKSKELLWKVCKMLNETELRNIAVIHQRAENIDTLFNSGEVQKIYLNFSDPWPKTRHDKRRLTHGVFLQKYKNILQKEGEIHFKTDSLELFEFSLEEFKQMKGLQVKEATFDLHKEVPTDNIMTEYEEKFVKIGKSIYKCVAQVKE